MAIVSDSLRALFEQVEIEINQIEEIADPARGKSFVQQLAPYWDNLRVQERAVEMLRKWPDDKDHVIIDAMIPKAEAMLTNAALAMAARAIAIVRQETG